MYIVFVNRIISLYNITCRQKAREHSSAGRASALQAEGHRFEPCCSHHNICWHGSMAEQLICNQQVVGSTPIASSIHGGVPEWPKGADCKSVIGRFRWFESILLHHKRYLCIFFYLFKLNFNYM